MIEPSATRDRLTAGMFVSSSEDNPVGAIELALAATLAADPIEAKIKDAVKAGRLSVKPREDRIAAAQSAGIITAEESSALRRAQRLVDKVVRVDDFRRTSAHRRCGCPPPWLRTKLPLDALTITKFVRRKW